MTTILANQANPREEPVAIVISNKLHVVAYMVARTVQTALMCICVFLPVKGFISEMSTNTIKMKKSTLKVTP